VSVELDEVLDAAIAVTEATAELLKDFSLGGGGAQLVPYDLAGQRSLTTRWAHAAGIAVVAQSSGRVLLLQRSNKGKEEDDPAAGTWEFPGGKCKDGETSWPCAQREWEEEVGCKLPPGQVVGQWDSDDNKYRCYVWLIDDESQINLYARSKEGFRDPDEDEVEAAAWWDIADLYNMPALRPEVRTQTDWGLLRRVAGTKKALGELSALARYLRHGKPIEKFVAEWLPEQELVLVTKGMEAGSSPASACAASRARLLLKAGPPAKASRRARQREQALRGVLTGTAGQLGRLAANAHRSHLSFIDAATDVLRDAYARAYLAGKAHALTLKAVNPKKPQPTDDGGVDDGVSWEDLPPDVQDELTPGVDQQHQFLQGLSQDLVAGLSVAALAARLDQYASSAIPIYEQGYQDGAVEALTPDDPTDEQVGGGIIATWMVTADDPCRLCEEKNGQVWPQEEAPLPGDGDFGEICKGAMNCRCVLEYEYLPAGEYADAIAA
jgi:8-oxo-dGTP pyrophosphatase MutT (NUDIX family)